MNFVKRLRCARRGYHQWQYLGRRVVTNGRPVYRTRCTDCGKYTEWRIN